MQGSLAVQKQNNNLLMTSKAYRILGSCSERRKLSYRQTMGDKILSREGKSPDRVLRSLNLNFEDKVVLRSRQSVGELGSSYPLEKV